MVWATTKDGDSGGKHIFWTPNLGIHLKKVSGEIKGDVSVTTFLAHEFGH